MEGIRNRTRLFLRTLAAVCSAALLIQTAPLSVIALPAEGESEPSLPETAATSSDEEQPAVILGEDTAKRTEESKEFALSDGTCMIAMYGTPIHYQDENGKWQDYDNTMMEEASPAEETSGLSDGAEKEYINRKSDKEIRLANKSEGEKAGDY